MATREEYIADICETAERLASSDMDTANWAHVVFEAARHMLSERVCVVPGIDDDDTRHVKRVLCEWWLGFYMMAIEPELGGSTVDYCSYHVLEALDGYIVESYDDTQAMLADITPAADRALDPERLYMELAGIGIEQTEK